MEAREGRAHLGEGGATRGEKGTSGGGKWEGKVKREGGSGEGGCMEGRKEGPVGTEGHPGKEGHSRGGEIRVCQRRASAKEKGPQVEGASPQGKEGSSSRRERALREQWSPFRAGDGREFSRGKGTSAGGWGGWGLVS